MARSFVLLLTTALMAIAPADACSKLRGNKPDTLPDIPPPPTVTSAAATTPPIYTPPDLNPGPGPGPATPSVNPDLAKARSAAAAGEWKKVRALLAAKVKAGKSLPEETQLLFQACQTLKDKACVDSVRKAHPELEPPPCTTAHGMRRVVA